MKITSTDSLNPTYISIVEDHNDASHLIYPEGSVQRISQEEYQSHTFALLKNADVSFFKE